MPIMLYGESNYIFMLIIVNMQSFSDIKVGIIKAHDVRDMDPTETFFVVEKCYIKGQT